MVVPFITPDALPHTPEGYYLLRERDALRAVLRQEGDWVRKQLRPEVRPRTATDSRWLDDDVDYAVHQLWAEGSGRGTVWLWPGELDVVVARDIPPGVKILVEADADGVLRRGVKRWPLVVDADLGSSRTEWDGSLDLDAYLAIVRAAVDAHAARTGEVEVVGDTIGGDQTDHVSLVVRVRLRTSNAGDGFWAAQAIFKSFHVIADQAEADATRAVAQALRAIVNAATDS